MPISPMQEKVTKAILPAFEHIADPAYRETIAGCWARVAMEAMVTPTPDMVVRADEEAIEVLNDHSFALKEPTLGARAYTAAVKAALHPADTLPRIES